MKVWQPNPLFFSPLEIVPFSLIDKNLDTVYQWSILPYEGWGDERQFLAKFQNSAVPRMESPPPQMRDIPTVGTLSAGSWTHKQRHETALP